LGHVSKQHPLVLLLRVLSCSSFFFFSPKRGAGRPRALVQSAKLARQRNCWSRHKTRDEGAGDQKSKEHELKEREPKEQPRSKGQRRSKGQQEGQKHDKDQQRSKEQQEDQKHNKDQKDNDIIAHNVVDTFALSDHQLELFCFRWWGEAFPQRSRRIRRW